MEQVSLALEPVRTFLIQLGQFLPRLIIAVAILVAGWLLAKFLRYAVVKGLKMASFPVLTEKAGIDRFLEHGGVKPSTVEILALLIYWLVILAALVIGFNTLGLSYVTDLLGQILRFIPKVIVAVLILAIGLYFARFIADTVTASARNIGLADAGLLGRAAYYAIMAFVILIALDQVNVGGSLIRQAFLIVLGGVALALALAFGIAGQKLAAEQLERWVARRERGTKKEA